MDATAEIERLLAENNAVLVRQNKHLVYRLSNGQTFVMAKTSSDPVRSAKNSLSDLRRALGIAHPPGREERENVSMQVEAVPVLPPPSPAPEPINENTLASRIEAAITVEENNQERLMVEAQAVERRVQMLRALLPFAGDPSTEAALKALVPPPEPPKAESAPQNEPAPPQRITERVQVTRELVFAATQTFDCDFTVNDVLALMMNGAEIDGAERTRVRSSIASAMMALLDRGQLCRVSVGIGKRQTVLRKIPLNGHGTRA